MTLIFLMTLLAFKSGKCDVFHHFFCIHTFIFFCNDSIQNLIFVSSLRALLVWWIVLIFFNPPCHKYYCSVLLIQFETSKYGSPSDDTAVGTH